jgi:putative transposase
MSLPRFNEDSYSHFVTTKTWRGLELFSDPKCCRLVLDNLEFYRKSLGFDVLGYCIVPDHIHLVVWWDVEEKPKLTIGKIMQGMKSHSAKEIVAYLKTGR